MSSNFNIWFTHESIPIILVSPGMFNIVHEKALEAPGGMIFLQRIKIGGVSS